MIAKLQWHNPDMVAELDDDGLTWRVVGGAPDDAERLHEMIMQFDAMARLDYGGPSHGVRAVFVANYVAKLAKPEMVFVSPITRAPDLIY